MDVVQKGRQLLSGLRKYLKIIITVGVVVAIALMYLLIVHLVNQNRHDKKLKALADYQTMIKAESQVVSFRDDKAAKKLILDFLNKYPNFDNKSDLQRIDLELSAIYQRAGDNQNGLQWLLKSLQDSPKLNYNDYMTVGELYDHMKDKANAIKYYDLALAEIAKNQKNGSDVGQEYVYYINYQINALNAKK